MVSQVHLLESRTVFGAKQCVLSYEPVTKHISLVDEEGIEYFNTPIMRSKAKARIWTPGQLWLWVNETKYRLWFKDPKMTAAALGGAVGGAIAGMVDSGRAAPYGQWRVLFKRYAT